MEQNWNFLLIFLVRLSSFQMKIWDILFDFFLLSTSHSLFFHFLFRDIMRSWNDDKMDEWKMKKNEKNSIISRFCVVRNLNLNINITLISNFSFFLFRDLFILHHLNFSPYIKHELNVVLSLLNAPRLTGGWNWGVWEFKIWQFTGKVSLHSSPQSSVEMQQQFSQDNEYEQKKTQLRW